MNIAMVTGDKIPGTAGGAVHLFETAKGLVKMGCDVHVVTKRYEDQRECEELHGVKVYRVRPSKGGLGLNAFKIARKTFSLKPDAILARDAFYTFTLIMYQKASFKKTPIVFEGILTRVPGLEPKKLPFSSLKYWLYDFATKECLKHVDAVVAQTSFAKGCCIKLGAKSSKTFIVPPTVDLEKFNYERYKDKEYWKKFLGLDGFPVVTYCGSLDPWHNVDVLIKAIPLVTEKLPAVKFLFLISAKDCKKAEVMLEGLRDKVLLKSIPHDEVPQYLAASDVFVVTRKGGNILSETEIPTKILEAMALGLPIIAGDVKALREYFTEEDCLFCPTEDHEKLASSIIQLLLNPKEPCEGVLRLSAKSSKFSLEAKSTAIIKVLKSLINCRWSYNV